MLAIEDLNPQTKLKWRMSRSELLKLAIKAARAALKPKKG